jgi:hypothetical protein
MTATDFIDIIRLLCYFSFYEETNTFPHTYAYILGELSGFVSVCIWRPSTRTAFFLTSKQQSAVSNQKKLKAVG